VFALKGLRGSSQVLDPPFDFLIESLRPAVGLGSLSVLFSVFSLSLFLALKKKKFFISVFLLLKLFEK
jgi:hypothetical protein